MTINGTAGPDTLPGTANNDTISGLDGSDSLLGFAGADLLQGGNGNDTLDAGNQDDILSGGDGDDVLVGGDGNDVVSQSFLGNDTNLGGNSNDTFAGGLGSDLMDGGSGDDFVDYRPVPVGGVILDLALGTGVFGGGTDTLVSVEDGNGTNAGDTILGTAGRNFFLGVTGDDFEDGRAGADFLSGDSGNDTLSGGLGSDDLEGEIGRDLGLWLDRSIGSVTVRVGTALASQTQSFVASAGDVLTAGEADDFFSVEELQFVDGSYTPAAQIQASNGFIREGSAGVQSMEFILALTGPVPHDVTVTVSTSSLTATAGADYDAFDSVIFIPAFQEQVTFSIDIIGDALAENDETFEVEFSDPQGAVFAGGAPFLQRTGTILTDEGGVSAGDDVANDTTSGVELAIGDSVLGTIEVTSDRDWYRVFLTAGTEYHLALDGRPSNHGTLSDPFLSLRDVIGNELTFDNNSGQGRDLFLSFTPQTTGVHFLEASGSGNSITGTYRASIVLATDLPELSVDDFSVVEGTGGDLVAQVSVRSSRIYDQTITVLATPGNSSAEAGEDFDPEPRQVTIFAGNTTGFAEIPIVTDAVLESDEIFSIQLSNPTNAVVSGDALGFVEIINDDAAAQITIAGAAVAEGNAGPGAVLFAVGLDGPVQGAPLVVDFQVFSGSAIVGTDFTNIASGSVTIPAGQNQVSLPVFPLGDTLFEGDQILYATLSGVTGSATAAIGSPAAARGTILDDDPVPTVVVNGVTSIGGGGSELLSGGALRDLLVGAGGNDVVLGGQEADRIEGGDGNDFLLADLLLSDLGATTGGADAVLGGAGPDSVLAGAGNDTVTGDADADLLVGQEGRDLLVGGDGNDALYGIDQADTLKGGNGDDFLFGDSAPDTMDGGADNDRLYVDIDDFVADGNDGFFDAVVITGPGPWVIDLGNPVNQNVSGTGPRLVGFEVVDAAVASSPVNMTGFASNGGGNVLYGTAFGDTITGSSATDIILGGDGGDVINAGAGSDSIGSEQGNDTLTGGTGFDSFIYFAIGGGGDIVITDFEVTSDDLWLPSSIAATGAAALALGAQVGPDAVFTFNTGGSVTLAGVPLALIGAGDFVIF